MSTSHRSNILPYPTPAPKAETEAVTPPVPHRYWTPWTVMPTQYLATRGAGT